MKWTELNNREINISEGLSDMEVSQIKSEMITSITESKYMNDILTGDLIGFNNIAEINGYSTTEYIEEGIKSSIGNIFKSIDKTLDKMGDAYRVNLARQNNMRQKIGEMNANTQKVNAVRAIYKEQGTDSLMDKHVTLKEYEVDEHILKSKAVLATHSLSRFLMFFDLEDSKTNLKHGGLLSMANDSIKALHNIMSCIETKASMNDVYGFMAELDEIERSFNHVYKVDMLGHNYQVALDRCIKSYHVDNKQVHPHINDDDLKLLRDISTDSKLSKLTSMSDVLGCLRDRLHSPDKDTDVSGESLYNLVNTYNLCNNIVCYDSKIPVGETEDLDINMQDSYTEAYLRNIDTMKVKLSKVKSSNTMNAELYTEAIQAISKHSVVLMNISSTLSNLYGLSSIVSDMLIKDFRVSMKKISNAIDRFNMTDSEKLNLVLLMTAGVGLAILAL